MPTIILSVGLYGLFAKLKLIGEWYGLVLAHTVLALPFVVLVIVAGLRDFDRALEQAAEGLGASRVQTLCASRCRCCGRAWCRPACWPSSRRSTSWWSRCSWPGQMTLPKKMFDNILMEIDPTIAAVSVMQILLVSIVLVLIGRFGRGLSGSAR